MVVRSLTIIDENPERRKNLREKLEASGFQVIESETVSSDSGTGQLGKPDLVLVRLGSSVESFHSLAARFHGSGTFLVPFIESGFSPDFRKKVLDLKADGFINEALPVDEWIAEINALIRKKRVIDKLNLALKGSASEEAGSQQRENTSERRNLDLPLRDREPELYQNMLSRYEEGVKLVLRRRIYKINDDAFEPFRQIAKQLFLAKATARDAVQLHYQTLRRMAPAPDAPRAQGYLEVGRTTIIGLMGDLLTYYRDDHMAGSPATDFKKNASAASAEDL